MADKIFDIAIYQNGLSEITQYGNTKRTKLTDFKSLANLLSSHSSVSTPLIPPNTIKVSNRAGRIRLLIQHGELVYGQKYKANDHMISGYSDGITKQNMVDLSIENELQYFDKDGERTDRETSRYRIRCTMKSYLPKALIGVELYKDNGGMKINLNNVRMVYYFDDILTMKTQLYYYPYGNASDGGGFCFGGMRAPSGYDPEDLRGVVSFHDLWLNAESNSDLGFRVQNETRFFNFVCNVAEALKPFPDIRALKENQDAHKKVVDILKANVVPSGQTFGLLIRDYM